MFKTISIAKGTQYNYALLVMEDDSSELDQVIDSYPGYQTEFPIVPTTLSQVQIHFLRCG